MKDALSAEKIELIKQFSKERIAFNRFLGVEVTDVSKGACTVTLPYKPELQGDPFREIVHGGVLACVIDIACGAACFSMMDFERQRISTVDMRVDFLEPGYAADIICEAHVVRMGNRVAATHAEVYMGERHVASGRAVFNVVTHSKNE